jgi:hypothetical protein
MAQSPYKSKRSNPSLGSMSKRVVAYQETLKALFSSDDPQKKMTKIADFPAYMETWTGSRYAFGAQQVNEVTHRLKVRREHITFELDVYTVFEWNDRKFELIRQQDLDEKNRYLFIEVKELSSFNINTV